MPYTKDDMQLSHKLEQMLDGLRFRFNLELITQTKETTPRGAITITTTYKRVKQSKNTLAQIDEALQAKVKDDKTLIGLAHAEGNPDDKPMDKLVRLTVVKL